MTVNLRAQRPGRSERAYNREDLTQLMKNVHIVSSEGTQRMIAREKELKLKG